MTNKTVLTQCPVCDAEQLEHFAQAYDAEYCTSKEMFQYDRCQSCELVFLNPPLPHRLNEIYPKNYYSYRSDNKTSFFEGLKRQMDAKLITKLISEIPGKELSLLDVGGGWGWLLSVARDASTRVRHTHIIDMNSNAEEQARKEGHEFHVSRIETFESSKKFDLILVLNLIEHVEDPRKVLKILKNLLSDQGLILIKTPNTDSLDQRIFRHRNWGGFHCPRHWILFTMKNLSVTAERCGLTVKHCRYTQGGPQWCNSIMAWLAKIGWVKISQQRPMYDHPLYVPLCSLAAAFDFLRQPFFPTAQMFHILTHKKKNRATIN